MRLRLLPLGSEAAALGRSAAPRRRPLASARGAQAVRWLRLCFWGSRAAPAARYCDGLSQQPRANRAGRKPAATSPRPPEPSTSRWEASASEARAVPRQLFALAGSAKDARLRRYRARQPAHGSVRHLDSAARKSDPAVGRSTHTRGTACLPRAALPNKGAPRP